MSKQFQPIGSLEKHTFTSIIAKLQKRTITYNSLQFPAERALEAVKHQQLLFLFTQIMVMGQIVD